MANEPSVFELSRFDCNNNNNKFLFFRIMHAVDWHPTILAAAGVESGNFISLNLSKSILPSVDVSINC